MTQTFPSLLAVGIGPLGMTEILIILFIVMLLFGAKRLPDLARSFGKSIKEFKKGAKEIEQEINSEDDDDEPTPTKNGAATATKPKTADKK